MVAAADRGGPQPNSERASESARNSRIASLPRLGCAPGEFMAWDIAIERGVAVVRMRSNAVNKMNPGFFGDLQRAFDRLDADYPDCAVVLTGQARTFSAGSDFRSCCHRLVY